jgi:adenosine deaminase
MAADFEAALVAGDIALLRAIPKADLHNHFTSGGNRDYVRERTGVDVAPLDHVLKSMDEMHEWMGQHIGRAFHGPEGRMIGLETTLEQARLDGVTRLDCGEDVWAMTLWENRDVARLTETMRAIHARIAPEIEWIPQMGLSRHCPIQYLMEWSAPFLELDFYQSVDLYADEFAQPIGIFKPVYRAAKAKGLRLRAHAGEWGTADDVWQAVEELELDEVQHGIAAASSPQVMRFLADNRIRLNICPTSNIMLGRVESMAAHPIRKLFDAGVIVTVNTDDALMFGIGVTDEYLALYRAGVFTADELDQIRLNGLTDQPLRP